MSDDLHAIALLGSPVAAAVLVWRYRGTPRPGITANALVPGLAMLLVLGGFGTHLCAEGNPVTQVLIPGVSAIAVMLLVSNARARVWMSVTSIGAMLILSFHYVALVHNTAITGNPRLAGYMANQRESLRQDYQGGLAKEFQDDTHVYPAGWLSDAPFFAGNETLAPEECWAPVRDPVDSLWHSFFTRLYLRRSHRVCLWFPGGTPSKGAQGLEWRRRPRIPSTTGNQN